MKYYLGIDLGGTNIAAGVCDESRKIISKISLPTNAGRTAEEIADDMIKAAKTAAEKAEVNFENIEWVGIGSPGSCDSKTGTVLYACNLPFKNTDFNKLIGEKINKRIYLENDANAAAYGEMLAGAAKGLSDVILVTIGTGIGGGIIAGGRIYSGHNGCGGELGHSGMVFDGYPCTCGRKGCIESYCSVTALIRLTKEAMQKDKDSAMWAVAEGSLDNVNGKTAFDAMRMNDKTAVGLVNLYTSYLAYAIANYINIFQPQAVVVGGGISKEGEALLAPVRALVGEQDYNRNQSTRAKIVAAELGNDAGIIGAAFLGLQA